MQMRSPPSSDPDDPEIVVSPFAKEAATIIGTSRPTNTTLLLVIATVILVGGGTWGGIYFAGRLSDPLRTLEKFPVAKYFESYRSLEGSRFKGELRVEADLGWKEGIGRLMVFTTPEDNRSIVVLIPASLSSIYFVKGQSYVAELEVKESGLVYANTCRKN